MADNETEQIWCGGRLSDLAASYGDTYHPYLAIHVCVFGTINNILTIAVLTRKEMSTAPINRILTALAIADMLLLIEYIPYAYFHYFVSRKYKNLFYVEAVFMVLHNHVSQVLHTTSICLALTLAVWRYLAIGHPQRSAILCTERRCHIAIALSFVLSIFLCIPAYLTTTIKEIEATENNQLVTLYIAGLSPRLLQSPLLFLVSFLFYSVFIKLIPCCILTVISIWLIYTLRKAKKRKQILRSYDCAPLKKKASKSERRADRTTKMLVAILFLFVFTEFPQGIYIFFIALKGKSVLFNKCYQKYGEIMDILALINQSINFILYYCMNRKFRATFLQMWSQKIMAKWYTPTASHSTWLHWKKEANTTTTTVVATTTL